MQVTVKYEETVVEPLGTPQTFPLMLADTTPLVEDQSNEYKGYQGYMDHREDAFVEHPWIGLLLKAAKAEFDAAETPADNKGFTADIDEKDLIYLQEAVARSVNFEFVDGEAADEEETEEPDDDQQDTVTD